MGDTDESPSAVSLLNRDLFNMKDHHDDTVITFISYLFLNNCEAVSNQKRCVFPIGQYRIV